MMSEEEKAAYLAEVETHVNSVADGWCRQHLGRTFNGDAEDERRKTRMAAIPHAHKNGDSSHQPDTMQKIRRDYPDLFPEDAA